MGFLEDVKGFWGEVEGWLWSGGVEDVWRMWMCGCCVEEVDMWMLCGGYGGVAVVWRIWRCGFSVAVWL